MPILKLRRMVELATSFISLKSYTVFCGQPIFESVKVNSRDEKYYASIITVNWYKIGCYLNQLIRYGRKYS